MHQSMKKIGYIWSGIKTKTLIFLSDRINHNRKNKKRPNTYDFTPIAGGTSTFGVKRITAEHYKRINKKLIYPFGYIRISIMIYNGRREQSHTNSHINILFGKKSSQYISQNNEWC